MIDTAALFSDPAWLPHRIDLAERRVMFLRINRETAAEHGFLANHEGQAEQAWMPLADYAAFEGGSDAVHFVFHTGFCRSTLLIRALDIEGRSVGLNEPGILNSIVKAGPAASRLLRPTLDLLSRCRDSDERVIVKPSNYANPLIEPILRARPASRMILMTDPLPVFLSRVARKGLVGRVWGRQVFLETLAYCGKDLGIDLAATAAMTDLQAAGLAWFLMQRTFSGLLAGEDKGRLRSLHGDRFDRSRGRTLSALASFLGIDLEPAQAEKIAQGPVFLTHSKLGEDFAATEAEAVRRVTSPAIDEEIAQVAQWIAKLAGQGGRQDARRADTVLIERKSRLGVVWQMRNIISARHRLR